jgi:hypothetical protein
MNFSECLNVHETTAFKVETEWEAAGAAWKVQVLVSGFPLTFKNRLRFRSSIIK